MRSRALTLARVAARAALCSGAAPRPAAPWQRLQQRRHPSSWLAAAAAASSAADGKHAAAVDVNGNDGKNNNNSSNSKTSRRRRPKHVRLPSHWSCPACGTRCVRPAVFARHLRACCPDIVPPEAWRAATRNAEAGVVFSPSSSSSSSSSNNDDDDGGGDGDASPSLAPEAIEEAEALLAEARRLEEELREKILVLSFRTLPPPPPPPEASSPSSSPSTSSSSSPSTSSSSPPPFSRMPVCDVARRLGLPEKRVAASLKAAVRATPLVADDVDGNDDADDGGNNGETRNALRLPSPVIFEDDDVLAFAKPSGIITAPKHRHEGGSLVARAIAHLNRGGTTKEREETSGVLKTPFPVHRLDMSTSGVVVMGKTSAAAAALQRQFRLRTAKKVYLALVAGRRRRGEEGSFSPSPSSSSSSSSSSGETWEVNAAIGRHPELKVGRRVVVDGGGGGGGGRGRSKEGDDGDDDSRSDGGGDESAQPALTRFVVLSQCDGSAVERALRRRRRRSNEQASSSSSSSSSSSPPPPPPFSSLFSSGALAAAGEAERALREGAALLACAPRTGRTHQIRVHARFCGLPILGDELYGPTFVSSGAGGEEEEDEEEGEEGSGSGGGNLALAPSRLLLHAAALELEHPSSSPSPSSATKPPLRLSAPLPEEFRRAMRALGLEEPPEDLFEVLPRSLWE